MFPKEFRKLYGNRTTNILFGNQWTKNLMEDFSFYTSLEVVFKKNVF